VGPWLVRHLEAMGDAVVVAGPEVDVTDPAAIGGAVAAAAADAVYHLAAQSSVDSSWTSAARTFEVNALGTLNVLESARACPTPPKVLLVSSAEAYGVVDPARLPVNEDTPLRPATPYGASKASAELIGLQQWLAHGLAVVRARPFNHTGPGQQPTFVVPALARQIALAERSGARSISAGNLQVARDLTDVRDVVRAYRLLIEGGQPGEVYNVCTGRSVTIEELARRLLHVAGVDLAVEVDPQRVRRVDLPDMRGDVTRLGQATGWRPEVDLDQTLRDVLDAWRLEVAAGTADAAPAGEHPTGEHPQRDLSAS